jgi:hypothetical protein
LDLTHGIIAAAVFVRKFSVCHSSLRMQHLTKEILTAKITKATKGLIIWIANFVIFVCFAVKFALFYSADFRWSKIYKR